MRKILAAAAVAAFALFGSLGAASAQVYEGGWAYDDNAGGREVLYLGDSSDNTFRVLRGTARYCGTPGDSYARVRAVLNGNYTSPQPIAWWVTDTCDDSYVRVCAENQRGHRACSTYIDGGWQ